MRYEMKKILSYAATVFCLLVAVGVASADWFGAAKLAPEWFTKRQEHKRMSAYYGYGLESDLEKATAQAKADLCRAIRTDITSVVSIEEQLKNDRFTKEIRQLLKETADCSLTDWERVRWEQAGEKWYVLVKYEYLPLGKKCKLGLRPEECAREKQNRYLERTQLMKEINSEMGVAPAFRVKRDDNNRKWYLTHARMKSPLPLSDSDLIDLLASCSSSNRVGISVAREELVEGTSFTLLVKAAQDGYVTVFDVYENGQVFIIAANQKIASGEGITIPDPSSENELVSGLLKQGKASQDMYVAVYTPNMENFSRMQTLGKQLNTGEEHYKFAELLDYLDEYEYSTVLVRTLPKKGL